MRLGVCGAFWAGRASPHSKRQSRRSSAHSDLLFWTQLIPVGFGTEFHLRALFFINRDITLSLENFAFQRAKAQSKILDYQLVK